VVRDDDFLEGVRGRGYTARRNPAVTHGRIELFIVMAACSIASSLCVGVRGRRETQEGAGSLRFARCGRILFPSLTASSFSLPRALALSVEHFGIYKYRYQTLSLSLSFPVCYNTATRSRGTTIFDPLPHARHVPPLPRSLSRPFCSYTYATGRPLPVYPAGCPTPTYMAAAQLYPSG